MSSAIVTGNFGLVGRAVAERFCGNGWTVHGWDNAERVRILAKDCLDYGRYSLPSLSQNMIDVSDVGSVRMGHADCGDVDLIVHCAGQPSHDWSATNPVRDFEVNAVGTLNMLELARRMETKPVFVFMSTNKVYGDWPNTQVATEYETRWRLHRSACVEDEDRRGFSEYVRVDDCTHSPFGCSKLAADIYVQEYGRYYGLQTCCLRAGCITGRHHAGVELHGFLAYLFRCAREKRRYTIYGYKGKQVRDNLHADDLAALIEMIAADPPPPGTAYNVGGGYDNSCSVLEAIADAEHRLGVKMDTVYDDRARVGDHRVYYTDLTAVRTDYPAWTITMPLNAIYDELAAIGANDHEQDRHTTVSTAPS